MRGRLIQILSEILLYLTFCSVRCLRSSRIVFCDRQCQLSVQLSYRTPHTPIARAIPRGKEPHKPHKSQSHSAQSQLYESSEIALVQCVNAQQLLEVYESLAGTNITELGYDTVRKDGRKFDCLPDALQELLLSTVVRLEYTMYPHDVARLLSKLGDLEFDLTSAPSIFRDTIQHLLLRSVKHMTARDISKALWGLAVSSAQWDSLSSITQWDINVSLRKNSNAMTHNQVAKCAHAISLLCFDTEIPTAAALRGAHETLFNQLLKRPKPSSEKNVKIRRKDRSLTSLHGHSKLQIFAHYAVTAYRVRDVDNRVPQDVLQPAEDSQTIHNCSYLQQRVTAAISNALQSLDSQTHDPFVLQTEYSHFGGVLPVDVAILQHDKVLALVEIDGPFHYRRDGSLLRKDQFKESLYRRALPGVLFHRVHYEDVAASNADVAVSGFIQALSAAHSGAPWLRKWRGIVRRLRSFINWILRNSQFDEYKHF